MYSRYMYIHSPESLTAAAKTVVVGVVRILHDPSPAGGECIGPTVQFSWTHYFLQSPWAELLRNQAVMLPVRMLSAAPE